MRHTIETAPRNGNVVILEDDASGTYDVAHWSPEAGEWIGENGEPSKITPSHWYPLLVDNHLQQELDLSSSPSEAAAPASRARGDNFSPFSFGPDAPQPPTAGEIIASHTAAATPMSVAAVEAQTAPVEATRRAFATSWIAATLVTVTLVGIYLVLWSTRGDEAAQLNKEAESAMTELRQSLQQEHDRAEALASELASARRDAEARRGGAVQAGAAAVSAAGARPERGQQRETLPIAGFALDGNKFDGIYLGRRKGKDLIYAGKVDHGFDPASAKDLQERLKPLIRKTQPYAKKIARRGIWVEPSLLAEIEYRTKSAEGKLRHPLFKGLREEL
jgi:hypothetical protein